MDIIVLEKVSCEEFSAYFRNLSWRERSSFVKFRRSEIAELNNPDILDALCNYGYFNALLPLVSVDEDMADRQIIRYYTPGQKVRILPSSGDERKILQYAAKRLYVVRFLREKTLRFQEFSNYRIPFCTTIYENATQSVADYLVGWTCLRKIPLNIAGTQCLFAKASSEVIRKYLLKVGYLRGNNGYISAVPLKLMAQRTDISAEDRHELLLLTVNRLKVSPQTIRLLRRDGVLDF